MAAPQFAHPELPNNLRFDFDPVNKILLIRVDGRITDTLLAQIYQVGRRYSLATDAKVAIVDFSSVTEFLISAQLISRLAHQEPAMPHAAERPRFIVAPQTHAFGLFRMFQLMGEPRRPLLQVVHTLDEAFAALGVQSPHFEPLA
jgi:hypothetical protein